MFIIFILLLWDCRNKLVLWLVSSWDDMRGEKMWLLAEVAPRCMPELAAVRGPMALQPWVPGQISAFLSTDRTWRVPGGPCTSAYFVSCPFHAGYGQGPPQLLCPAHSSWCVPQEYRVRRWQRFLPSADLLASIWGVLGAVGSKTQRLHLSENLSFLPEHQGDVVGSCQLSPTPTAWTRPDTASISLSEIPLQGHGLSKFPRTGIPWRTRGACEGSICNRSTVTILALPFQSENNLF